MKKVTINKHVCNKKKTRKLACRNKKTPDYYIEEKKIKNEIERK